MTDIEQEKAWLEGQRLRQELRHNVTKLYLSIIGAALVMLGLVADRIKTHEQRRHELELAQFTQRLTRMNSITEEYDRLFAQTKGVLYRNRTRTWQLINEVGMLHQKLRDLKTDDPEIARLQRYVEEVNSKLADSTVSVDEWADAMELEARWDSLSRSLTPDFEHYFGSDLLTSWREVRDAALAALQAEYSFRGTHPKEKLESFRERGSALQSQLYQRITDARKKAT